MLSSAYSQSSARSLLRRQDVNSIKLPSLLHMCVGEKTAKIHTKMSIYKGAPESQKSNHSSLLLSNPFINPLVLSWNPLTSIHF